MKPEYDGYDFSDVEQYYDDYDCMIGHMSNRVYLQDCSPFLKPPYLQLVKPKHSVFIYAGFLWQMPTVSVTENLLPGRILIRKRTPENRRKHSSMWPPGVYDNEQLFLHDSGVASSKVSMQVNGVPHSLFKKLPLVLKITHTVRYRENLDLERCLQCQYIRGGIVPSKINYFSKQAMDTGIYSIYGAIARIHDALRANERVNNSYFLRMLKNAGIDHVDMLSLSAALRPPHELATIISKSEASDGANKLAMSIKV